MNMRLTLHVFAILAIALAASSCSSQQGPPTASNLTAGMAKRTIVKGQTRQVEVMEIFGPPDLTTRTENGEVWTYDKIRYDMQSSGSFLTVLFAGATNQKARSSSTSTMLIIYFDPNDIVKEYRMSTTRF